ncbi:hypothetical protein KBD45_03310 [Candidatus Dojkabacteria bacterium]|nr:hypothetical protein [Candidatus Dojkabacteria bacterium]
MKFYEIKQKIQELRIFSVNDLLIIDPTFRRQTLYDWEENGWVIKLRNQRYIFSDFNPSNYDLYLVANKLYAPSYISLELALNHYGIIPESVPRFTSVTTNKTNIFETKIGIFDYKSIDEKLFFGYSLNSTEYYTYKIASLEKAIIDYCYLNPSIKSISDFEMLRFNVDILNENLNKSELLKILKKIDSDALISKINLLFEYLKNDHTI